MTHARNTLRNAMTCRQDEPKLSRKTHLLGGDHERPCAVPQVRSEVSPARSERSGQTFPLARRGGKEKWEREAEAEIASHFEARNAVRTTVAIEPITTKSSARS